MVPRTKPAAPSSGWPASLLVGDGFHCGGGSRVNATAGCHEYLTMERRLQVPLGRYPPDEEQESAGLSLGPSPRTKFSRQVCRRRLGRLCCSNSDDLASVSIVPTVGDFSLRLRTINSRELWNSQPRSVAVGAAIIRVLGRPAGNRFAAVRTTTAVTKVL